MPLEGGIQETVLEGVYGSISFSPDGSRFAFVRRYSDNNEYSLFTAAADGTDIVKLATTSRPDNIDGPPSWSPDGRTIVCPRIITEGGFHFEFTYLEAVLAEPGAALEDRGDRDEIAQYVRVLATSRAFKMLGPAVAQELEAILRRYVGSGAEPASDTFTEL